MTRSRIAALLLAAPLTFAPAASADPTIPGCYGVGSGAFCDATLRVTVGETGSTPTPVCAYTCVDVGVPTVDPYDGVYQVCLDYSRPSGSPGSTCYVDVDTRYWLEGIASVVCEYNPRDLCG